LAPRKKTIKEINDGQAALPGFSCDQLGIQVAMMVGIKMSAAANFYVSKQRIARSKKCKSKEFSAAGGCSRLLFVC